jgi:hypothetical protein
MRLIDLWAMTLELFLCEELISKATVNGQPVGNFEAGWSFAG